MKALNAALLSALVCPGTGQIYSGYKRRGWLMVASFITVLIIMASKLYLRIKQEMTIIVEQQRAIDAVTIQEISAKVTTFSDNIFLNILFIVLIVIWLTSIIDAYIITRKK